MKNNEISKELLAQEMGLTVPKNVGDYINNTMQKYMERGLTLPKDYNVNNAVISSYLIIKQDPKLASCTQDSIASALLDMATMGLSASKKQVYFIPYNNELKASPSYFGKIMAIKRIKGVVDVRADVIYKETGYELFNDEYGNDEIKITKPCPLDKRNIDDIIGAWARIILDESVWGTKSYVCIMTLDQIKKSWGQGATKGNSPAHKNFGDEMCKKSVINRCCKLFVNSAKDNDVLIETLNRLTDQEYEMSNNTIEKKEQTIDFEIEGEVVEKTTIDM